MDQLKLPRSMIIKRGKQLHHHVCNARQCSPSPDEVIQTYYVDQHAYDAGWRYTVNVGPEPGWTCPDCCKMYALTNA